MIKKLITVLTALITLTMFSVSVSAAESVIIDGAGLFDEAELSELEARQQQVADNTGWNIAVITSDAGYGEDGSVALDVCEDYYDDLFGADSSSVVYLIDIDYRHIAMDGDVLRFINTSRLNRILDSCEERYFDYDDRGVLETFYDHLEGFYNNGTVAIDPNVGAKGDNYDPSGSGFSVGIGAVIGIIAAIIGIAIVVSSYKTHHAPAANCYLDNGSVDMYIKQDRFVREFTTRTKIESSSGGGGGSGGRSHGGGGSGGRR